MSGLPRLTGLAGRALVAGDPAAFEERLARLGAEYGRGLGARLEEMRAALERIRRTPDEPSHRRDLASHAHRLRGAAGSHGFPEVGRLAGSLEDVLHPPGDGRAAGIDEIEAAFAALVVAATDAQPRGDAPAGGRA